MVLCWSTTTIIQPLILPARGTADLFCLPELVVNHDGTLCVACLEMASMNKSMLCRSKLGNGVPKALSSPLGRTNRALKNGM